MPWKCRLTDSSRRRVGSAWQLPGGAAGRQSGSERSNRPSRYQDTEDRAEPELGTEF